MTPELELWFKRWNLPPDAIADFRRIFGIATDPRYNKNAAGEAAVQQNVRLEISRCGGRVWRNNTGVARDVSGRTIRYGLCNDSEKLNRQIKSSDLIGITPVVVSPSMAGMVIGVFTAIECKAPGWKYTGTEREQAQYKFLSLVASLGGIAKFTNGEEV